MGRSIGRAFDSGQRVRLAGFTGGVMLLHVVGWGLLLTYGVGHPAFLGLGGLAYTFGLRHAFDRVLALTAQAAHVRMQRWPDATPRTLRQRRGHRLTSPLAHSVSSV